MFLPVQSKLTRPGTFGVMSELPALIELYLLPVFSLDTFGPAELSAARETPGWKSKLFLPNPVPEKTS